MHGANSAVWSSPAKIPKNKTKEKRLSCSVSEPQARCVLGLLAALHANVGPVLGRIFARGRKPGQWHQRVRHPVPPTVC